MGSSSARPVWKSGDECISGKCLEFDGVDDYVEIANDPALNFGTGVFTISTWIKILPNDIDSDWHNVISKKTGYNNTDIGWMAWLDFRYPGSLSLRVNDGSNVNDDTPTSQYSLKSTIQDGNFHHISWVVNSNDTVTFYLDGIAQDSRSFSKSGSLDNSLPLQIGTQGSSKGVNAIQDEVKIYNYALSEDEIKQDFNQGSAVVFGSTNQTIGGTTTSLEYCIPGDTTYCAPPIAQWNFEEGTGTTAYDTSGSANHGSFGSGSSAPSWTTGKVGKALSFDGIDDHTKTGGVFTSLGTSNTPYSFTGWFKANSGETDGNIIHMSSLATGGAGWCLPPVALDAGKLTAFSWNGGLVTATGATTVQANTWYHFGITWDSTNGLRVFLNGRLDGSQSQTNYSASGSSNYIFLGFTPNQCSGNQGWFNGSVDQVKIYNYARTPAQIAYDYNRGAPVAWWKLDEDSGTQAADWSGNGLHGTLGSGSSAPTWLSGKFNNALSFDGNDYIDLGTPTSLNITQQISISAWIKRSALGGSDSIICKRLTTGNIQYCLRMFPDNKAYIGTYNGSSWTRAFSTSELISTTDWYHVLGTYDKSNFKIYINGVLENTQSYSSDLNNTSGKTSIGKMGEQNSDFFNGLIDDVRIYNYALTDTQIKTLYNNGAVSFN